MAKTSRKIQFLNFLNEEAALVVFLFYMYASLCLHIEQMHCVSSKINTVIFLFTVSIVQIVQEAKERKKRKEMGWDDEYLVSYNMVS